FCHPRCRSANDNACPRIDLLLGFSIVTCAESPPRPTISETLLSPLFRRGSRSNHTPKLILWLGLNVEHPYRASDFVHWPHRVISRSARSWSLPERSGH